ncbi:MAG TPA: DegT/DnrJ/EryC1/StrS family aminotransferase [Candidatus Polarisedimenticolia bacterium]|nr:DegT/DnrJ/EryC1/StrS family aminotransferase [Candidatus Polarisedimenticolia bacterium]
MKPEAAASRATDASHQPVRKNFLVFGSPALEEPEIQEVVETLRSGWIGTGPRVGRFEENFRKYIGARHALALNSCTAALHLSMIAAGIGSGDEVITTPHTFAATANSVIHTGATPVFADVDPATQNIDPALVERAITPKTRAILPVHFAGRPCDMDSILALARRHGLSVIEDAAHAIEAEYRGRHIGTIGDAACFSFYVTKNIVTGEGGMVTTSRDDWAEKIQTYGLHGLSRGAWKRYSDEGFVHYQVLYPGFKYNMTDMQAALGIHQLGRIEAYAAARLRIWQAYDEAFRDLPAATPSPEEPGTRHARHLYTLLLDLPRLTAARDQVVEELKAEGIGTGIHFIALHLHPYYRDRLGYAPEDFPNARAISERTISLPLSARLTDQDVSDVIAAVRKVLLRHS